MRNGRVFGAPAPTSPPWACENRLTATDETRTRAELPGVETSEQITPAELRLATRNHGFPLEALSYDLTPAGLHYLLVHYDIPVVDGESWRPGTVAPNSRRDP